MYISLTAQKNEIHTLETILKADLIGFLILALSTDTLLYYQDSDIGVIMGLSL
jgi:hypothetical protein